VKLSEGKPLIGLEFGFCQSRTSVVERISRYVLAGAWLPAGHRRGLRIVKRRKRAGISAIVSETEE
jgi:hypothetical protein